MKAIGRSDHVLVILSDNYLRSLYGMIELFNIYRRSLGEKEDFLKRVIQANVGDTGKCDDWRHVLNYVEH